MFEGQIQTAGNLMIAESAKVIAGVPLKRLASAA